MRWLLLFVFILVTISSQSQKYNPAYALVPDSLKSGANAIVRSCVTEFEREALGKLRKKEFVAITVLNKAGEDAARFSLPYDRHINVSKLSGRWYDSSGKLLKIIKEKGFCDFSSFQNFVFFSDNRVKAFAPVSDRYPFTIEYEYEIVFDGFVHVCNWLPVRNYKVAVEKALLRYTTPFNLHFKVREVNGLFQKRDYLNSEDVQVFEWSLDNLSAIKWESFSGNAKDVFPHVIISPLAFEYDGIKGEFSSWNGYGKWVTELLKEREELGSVTVEKIKELTASFSTNREKVKAVYKYIQERTRYVCVAIGIGGFQPMKASEVDEHGYGDCKALSLYTKALLNSIGIESYYTEIGSGNRQIVFDDFASADQTNHAILTVPLGEDTVWLECTNPYSPFGYVGVGNAHRKALMVTDHGGELVDMPRFEPEENSFSKRMRVKISENGSISGHLNFKATGLRYDQQGYLPVRSKPEQKEYLLENLPLANLEVYDYRFESEGEEVPASTMFVDFSAKSYADISGDRLFVPLNQLHRLNVYFKMKDKRCSDVVFPFGWLDEDYFEFEIPDGYVVDFLPKGDRVESDYLTYEFSVEMSEGVVVYERRLLLKEGGIPVENYSDIAQLVSKVRRLDNCKLVLKKE